MQRLTSRDATAFGVLFDRYQGLSLAVAMRVVGDRHEAEEVVQEAFLSLWRQAGLYRRDRGPVRGWLLSIVRHRAIDWVRRRAGRPALTDLDEILDYASSVDVFQRVEQQLLRGEIRVALAALPAEQRTVLELAYWGGLTHSEIAAQTGVPPGTVKGRLRLALQKLRESLTPIMADKPRP
jgi:RNA polymerase sigma-70 factor (ECF subfamily)